jgi:hypothetical protein
VGIYKAAAPPPATIQVVMCSVKIKDGFVSTIQNAPHFAGLPNGVTLFELHVGRNPTFDIAIVRP